VAPPNPGAALEFAALGTGLTLTTVAMARLPDWSHALGAFQVLDAIAFAFYGLSVIRLPRYRALPAAGLLVLAVALAARAALLPVTPTLSDDLYRYLWEGRVLVAGGDPYHQAPNDPHLQNLRDAKIWPRVNHPELATIYPPAAEAGFALVARVSPTVPAMKTWVLLHDLGTVAVLLLFCSRLGLGAASALVYAWNPLVLVEYAGNGHNEPTALLFLVLAVALAERRPILSGLALATGTLIKLAPIVALPFLLRRWGGRGLAACLALLVPGLALYLMMTRGESSGLGAYLGSWRNNALIFDLIERASGRFWVARAVEIAGVVAVLAFAWVRRRSSAQGTRDVLRAGLLLGPVMHPWYLGWVLVFEPFAPSLPWLLLALTSTLNYGFLVPPADRASYHLPMAGRWVEYGAPLLLAALMAVWTRLRGNGREARA
jgi:hypothetical protein